MSTARRYKTKYFAKSLFLSGAICLCLLVSAKFIFAQTQNQNSRTIIVSPPSVTDNFDPGAKKEGKMKLTNTSPTDTLTFKAVIRDFIVENSIGTPIIDSNSPNREKYAASSWVGVYPSTFTLAPGQTQEIDYYIQVPADARPGGRYAAVVYEPQERIDAGGTGTAVETHIGTLFIFRVNGDVVENASVKSFGTANKVYEYGPAEVKTVISNFSDTHVKPQGTIALKNIIGQTLETVYLNEHNIFPEADRDYFNTLGKKYMFGLYNLELRATYGINNNLTLFATTSFFVFPWKIVAIVVLVIVVAILLFIYLRRRKKNRIHQQPPVQQTQQTQPTQ